MAARGPLRVRVRVPVPCSSALFLPSACPVISQWFREPRRVSKQRAAGGWAGGRPSCVVEMLRLWQPEPAVGLGDVRDVLLPGLLGPAPRPRRAPELCSLRADGRLARRPAPKDGGLPGRPPLLRARTVAHGRARSRSPGVGRAGTALQLGGNRRAHEFLNAQPDYKPSMSIREKYNTRAAANYREKVRALACRGRIGNA